MREHKGQSLLEFPKSYVVIDTETTGLDPTQDRLIEIGALKIADGEVIDTFSSLINPGFSISPFIASLTGISNEMLASAPAADSVLTAFSAFIGNSILVGHNAHFDINFLYDNYERYLSQPLTNDFVDTLRLSKRIFKDAPSFKLTALADYLQITAEQAHRALVDCYTTKELYKKLEAASLELPESEKVLLDSVTLESTNPFAGKRLCVKGIPQLYSYTFMKEVAQKCGAKIDTIFYSSCDYIIFSHYTYKAYKRGDLSEKFVKADALAAEGKLTILSEEAWYKMLNIPVPHHAPSSAVSAKDIVTDKTDFDETHPLFGKLCVFTGTLEKMLRKDAMQLVVDFGGSVGNSVTKKTNYLILGNNDYCPLIKDGKSTKQKKAEELKLAGSDIEIISENVFYDMISEG